MSSFLYYFPGTKWSDTLPNEYGCKYAFDNSPSHVEITKGGPDNGSGLIVTQGSIPEYNKAEQIWQQAVKMGQGKLNFWVGMYKDSLPKPEDLIRELTVGFYNPILGDNNEWKIPTGRAYPDGTPLPKVRKIDDEGKITRKVKSEYQDLYTASDKVWSVTTEKEDITEQEEWEICRTALQTNYRISDIEISMLGLLEEETAMKLIFGSLIDYFNWPEFQEALNG